jgi:hypothetical protein
MYTCPDLAHQEAAGQVVGWVWNWTELSKVSKSGPLVGDLDPLLILFSAADYVPNEWAQTFKVAEAEVNELETRSYS